MKKVKEVYNPNNIILLLEMYMEALKKKQAGDKAAEEDYAVEVAKLAKAGKVSEADILELQNQRVPMLVIMDICSHMVVGPTGLTHHESIDLGHKVQFIALSHAKLTGGDVRSVFISSNQIMMDTIRSIAKGTYDAEKLQILKDLPHIEQWDHDLGAQAYSTFYS